MSISSTCIFCDDVRRERNGQMTFVGIYGARMSVKEFPHKYDKLAFAIEIFSNDEKVDFHRVIITVPGEEKPRSFKVAEDPKVKNITIKNGDAVKYERTFIKHIQEIEDLEVKQAGKITVEVETSAGKILSGSLELALQQPQQLPFQAAPIVIALLLNRKLGQTKPQVQKKYQPALLEVMNGFVDDGLENTVDLENSPFQFQTDFNSYRIISLNEIDTEQEIVFTKLPSKSKHVISERDDHGFKVVFTTPNNEEVMDFDWEFKE